MKPYNMQAHAEWLAAQARYLRCNGWQATAQACPGAPVWWTPPPHLQVVQAQHEFRQDLAVQRQEQWDNDREREQE